MKLYLDGKDTILNTDDIALITPLVGIKDRHGVLIYISQRVGSPDLPNIIIATESDAEAGTLVNAIASAMKDELSKVMTK